MFTVHPTEHHNHPEKKMYSSTLTKPRHDVFLVTYLLQSKRMQYLYDTTFKKNNIIIEYTVFDIVMISLKLFIKFEIGD